MYLAQEVRDGVCFVQLHLDPERKADPFSNLPQVKVLHGVPGAAPTKSTVALGWKNADLLEAAIPITGRETVLNTVEIAGQQAVTLPPVCLPYSPEYAPDQPGRGAAALAQIAATTGGKDRVEIPKIWGELPVKSRYVELAPWLLVVAAALFLLEVFERRTGGVSKLVLARRNAGTTPAQAEAETPVKVTRPAASWLRRKAKPASSVPAPANRSATTSLSTPPVAPKSVPAEPKPVPAGPASSGSAIDGLRKARERARSRTEK
jgi:hypothetical protein